MLLNFGKSSKGLPRATSSSTNISAAVNKSTTFGIGPAQWRVTDESHSADMMKNLCLLRNNQEMTDITFTFNGEVIAANRVVLAALSSVMRNVFLKRESLMNAEKVPPEALHQLVKFIYSTGTEVEVVVLKNIKMAAEALKIEVISRTCSKMLASLPGADTNDLERRHKSSPRTDAFDTSSNFNQSGERLNSSPLLTPRRRESTAADSDSTSDTSSDIITSGLRRHNKPSIKLTFHSRSGTPLSQSTEDLANDVTSVGSSDAKLEATPPGLGSRDNLPRIFIDSPKDNFDDKQSSFTSSRSIENFLLDHSGHDVTSSNDRGTVTLSSLLAVSSGIVQEAATNSSGTWPNRMRTSQRRSTLPCEWKTGETSPQTERPAEGDAYDVTKACYESRRDKERKYFRRTRDKLDVGFATKSIPNFLKGLNLLREQNCFCDLTIVVSNTRIQCHRVILAASSHVFRTILNRINTKEIVLTKIDEAAIQELIKFIYTGQCTIDKDNAMGTLRAARRFQFHFVALQCAHYLDRNCGNYGNFFNPDNVLVAFKIARNWGFPKLGEESKKFAVSHFWEITESSSFKDLSAYELNILLSSEGLRAAKSRDMDLELQLFKSLVHWLTQTPKSRIPRMTSRVMKFVDFSNIKHSALYRIVSKETVVMLDQDCSSRVRAALRGWPGAIKGNLSPGNTPQVYNPSDIYAVVTHREEYLSNKVYNMTQSNKTKRSVTSSPSWSGHAVTSYHGSLYVAGGRDAKRNKRICSDVYRFDCTGWTQIAGMKVARAHFALLPLDGALHAIGGLSENFDKQYQPTSSSERLDIESTKPGSPKWKLTLLSLPQASYSHAAVPGLTRVKKVNLDELSMKKPLGSPMKRKGLKLSPSFHYLPSDVVIPGKSPRRCSLRHDKPTSELMEVETIFVCGGKIKPRQNLMWNVAENRFVEKCALPCPSPKPTLTSSATSMFLVTNDAMDTSYLRMFEYIIEFDQWTEMKMPVTLARPPLDGAHIMPCLSSATFSESNRVIFVAVTNDDVIEIDRYDVTSSRWTSYKRLMLDGVIAGLTICSI
ncbi:uncharacterized protein LOC143471094 isoform X2 [Clavelina lepadiformis]|uniref:uncharacterized protein LOC143471094 isoform X2 n=1 Tax=Clavelina lepadiformis TaxID=159417 RepID=UPI0040412ADF